MDYHTYYVDNNKTAEHKSFFVGIRELEKKKYVREIHYQKLQINLIDFQTIILLEFIVQDVII